MKLGKSSSLNASLEKEYLTFAFSSFPLDTKVNPAESPWGCVLGTYRTIVYVYLTDRLSTRRFSTVQLNYVQQARTQRPRLLHYPTKVIPGEWS